MCLEYVLVGITIGLSQNRASDKSEIRANLLCHPSTKRATLDKDRSVVFVFCEESEIANYQSTFGPGGPLELTNILFFVCIPGDDRGVSFARSMIVIVQYVLRHALSSDPKIPKFD